MPPVVPNPWEGLRRFTDARIALGRAGVSQPTAPQLAFQAAHAQARDAVHLPLDAAAMRAALQPLGPGLVELRSAAADRRTYLQRPDLGRRLDAPSAAVLDACADEQLPPPQADGRRVDLAIVVADGLSALAVHRQAEPLLSALLPLLAAEGWALAPLLLVHQGRVALGDEVGERLGARLVLVLLGERPGLSSPDSLGAYLTWAPAIGLTDAARNCVSNIRPAGLAPPLAAQRLAWLLREARRRGLSGVGLKDESELPLLATDGGVPALASPPGR
ncbi:ethanolamine ammonia-lyase, light chain [Piscinibacter sakaiensis]|uniref:Ethanolamine ammonia-lyase small subunit n=1 Tax=Piscinibacter sakaiensis TaxID=1547922 RepID=A0A0K8P4N9_PISS1|nr:ethanolamine ammonia-lyase, light chain [Piscinibacter sakaiensis]